jgi:hypothetical protein
MFGHLAGQTLLGNFSLGETYTKIAAKPPNHNRKNSTSL